MVTALGRDYLGTTGQDAKGETCMDWTTLQVNQFLEDPEHLPDARTIDAHNYCRSTEINLEKGIKTPSCVTPSYDISPCDVKYCGK